MLTAILTIILFCIMIIPHELGHFVVAKLVGVQVNEFSMGMGPLLFQKQKGETLYSVRLLPHRRILRHGRGERGKRKPESL